MKTKYTFNSAAAGLMEYMDNGDLRLRNNTVNKTFTRQETQEISKAYQGANRMHKPYALLFWTDCKNGKAGEWCSLS